MSIGEKCLERNVSPCRRPKLTDANKATAILLIVVSAFSLAGTDGLAFTLLDRSIAIVGEEVILASELQAKAQIIRRRLQDKANQVSAAELQQRILDHLILEKLQLQLAERFGITIDETEVTQAVDRLQQNLAGEQQSMEAYLRVNGLLNLAALRENIHRELLIAKVQQYQVNRRIQVSEQDVDHFLNSKDGREWRSPRYRLRHILVAANSGGREDKQIAETRSQAIYQRLLAGADFAKIAVGMSDGSNAANGGDLGWRKSSDLPDLFLQQIKGREIGAIVGPFRSGAGIHMLQLVDRQGVDQALVQQSKVRHILIKTSAIIDDVGARRRLEALRVRALSGENFSALAKQYSEDIATALSGGDLGWSVPGKFVPAFESAMRKTPKHGISDPFQSPFGWHILCVEDRRRQDMTDLLMRNQALQLLRQLRFEDELQLWLREIRDNAYVEILI